MRVRYSTSRFVLPTDTYQRVAVRREYRKWRRKRDSPVWKARSEALDLAFYMVAMAHPETVKLASVPAR